MPNRRTFLQALATAVLTAAGGFSIWRFGQSRSGSELVASLPPALHGREPLLSFYLLSDIHMSVADSTMAEKLRMALTDMVRSDFPIDTLILGGDLVDGGREQEYQLLSKILSEYQLPKAYGNMGNHEYYDIWYNERGDWSKETMPNGKTDAQARERFMRHMGYSPCYHDVWINGIHLVMLSQETYVQERPEVGEGAWYSDEQMAWFAETMKPHADGSPAFVFIHQPLPPAGEDGAQHRVIRAKEFRSILQPYRNVFVLSGHTHRNLETQGRYVRDTTFHWFSNASVGKTRSGGSVSRPVQGLYLQVYPNQVVVLGREFSNRTWIEVAQWTVPLT